MKIVHLRLVLNALGMVVCTGGAAMLIPAAYSLLTTDLPATGKTLLAIFMLLGRLELFTVLVLLTPAFWRA